MASIQNLASGVLAADITASSTTLTVSCGTGTASALVGVWPTAPFFITVMPSVPAAGVANSLDSEVMKVTALSSSGGVVSMTVTRAQRGTTAKAFSQMAIVTNGIYIDDILDRIYPVGSIYMSATFSTATQVQNALGGTWVAWGSGRVPVGVDTSQTEFDTVEETGGAKTHRHDFRIGLVQFYGLFIGDTLENQGAWSYSQNKYSKSYGRGDNATVMRNNNISYTGTASVTDSVRYSYGDTDTASSLQPYITCYMYKRTA